MPDPPRRERRHVQSRCAGELRDQPALGVEHALDAVRPICADVQARGDAALLELAERFDTVRPPAVRVPAARGSSLKPRWLVEKYSAPPGASRSRHLAIRRGWSRSRSRTSRIRFEFEKLGANNLWLIDAASHQVHGMAVERRKDCKVCR